MTATDLIAHAKQRAGYADVDTPCEPSRSAYTDGRDGDAAFFRAERRWTIYNAVLDAASPRTTVADGIGWPRR